YVFVIDADEVLETPEDFALPTLTTDSYDLRIAYDGCFYSRKQLVRNALSWRYEGVVHEYITCEAACTEEFLPGPQTVPQRARAPARHVPARCPVAGGSVARGSGEPAQRLLSGPMLSRRRRTGARHPELPTPRPNAHRVGR